MEVKVGKWGSSLAIRLPAAECREARIGVGDWVDVNCAAGPEGPILLVRRVKGGPTLRARMEGGQACGPCEGYDWSWLDEGGRR